MTKTIVYAHKLPIWFDQLEVPRSVISNVFLNESGAKTFIHRAHKILPREVYVVETGIGIE